jgi:hypothetical protein
VLVAGELVPEPVVDGVVPEDVLGVLFAELVSPVLWENAKIATITASATMPPIIHPV